MRRWGSTRRQGTTGRTGRRGRTGRTGGPGRTGRTGRRLRRATAAAACAAALAALTAVPAQAQGPAHQERAPHWSSKDTGAPDVRFRPLAAVSRDTARVAGTLGTVLRTTDGGRTWRTVDTGSYDTVDRTPDRGCWAAGEKGRVARLEQ